MTEAVAQFNVDPSGVPGLDQVLGGGLPANNLVFVIGTSGAGKTVLALQVATTMARQERSIMFLTTFSESNDKLIAHMRGFSFFDLSMIGQQIVLLSVFPLLQPNSEQTIRKIVRMVRQSRTKLVVVDGFRGINELLGSEQDRRHFLQTLSTQLTYLGTTLLMTWETDPGDPRLNAELTIADSVLAFHYGTVGLRHQRMLEVRKVRGQQQQAGLHHYRITRDGIEVFPRLETRIPPEPCDVVATDRVSMLVPGLDKLLQGGLIRNTITVLTGVLGLGKTLLSLHFLMAGVANGEPGLLVTSSETPAQLVAMAATFGLDLAAALASDTLRIIRRPAVEIDVDELATVILAELEPRRIKRVVIDGIQVLEKALDREQRADDFLAALGECLRSYGVTSLLTITFEQDRRGAYGLMPNALATIGENVIRLEPVTIDQTRYRLLTVERTRLSMHDRRVNELRIVDGTIAVHPWLAREHPPGDANPAE